MREWSRWMHENIEGRVCWRERLSTRNASSDLCNQPLWSLVCFGFMQGNEKDSWWIVRSRGRCLGSCFMKQETCLHEQYLGLGEWWGKMNDGMDKHRARHLLDTPLSAAISLYSRKEKIWLRISSGNLSNFYVWN